MGRHDGLPADITRLLSIDEAAVDGLLGASNSLSYRVAEIERHIHSQGKWLGAASVPVGETHVADIAAGGISAFSATSGNDDFGAWVQVLGSSDTPIKAAQTHFDAHRYLVHTASSTSPYVIQIAAGESADLAAAVSSGNYSAAMYIGGNAANDHGVEMVQSSRVAAGTKVWVRICCIGQNAETLTFFIGLHEYEG